LSIVLVALVKPAEFMSVKEAVRAAQAAGIEWTEVETGTWLAQGEQAGT
jgi:hypothetical protein